MADRPPAERPYEFRRRLGVVHPPDRRDAAAAPDGDEVAVGPGWSIAVGARCDALVLDVARDLQDYLFTTPDELAPLLAGTAWRLGHVEREVGESGARGAGYVALMRYAG
jgi:hypothetical protein